MVCAIHLSIVTSEEISKRSSSLSMYSSCCTYYQTFSNTFQAYFLQMFFIRNTYN